ncbi:MAG: hypothetical protein M4579_003976 [Chaenotheca gracillima]|nr:MAG: hypothetical protein M4579_003976 [Chaenotheca gracillima]
MSNLNEASIRYTFASVYDFSAEAAEIVVKEFDNATKAQNAVISFDKDKGNFQVQADRGDGDDCFSVFFEIVTRFINDETTNQASRGAYSKEPKVKRIQSTIMDRANSNWYRVSEPDLLSVEPERMPVDDPTKHQIHNLWTPKDAHADFGALALSFDDDLIEELSKSTNCFLRVNPADRNIFIAGGDLNSVSRLKQKLERLEKSFERRSESITVHHLIAEGDVGKQYRFFKIASLPQQLAPTTMIDPSSPALQFLPSLRVLRLVDYSPKSRQHVAHETPNLRPVHQKHRREDFSKIWEPYLFRGIGRHVLNWEPENLDAQKPPHKESRWGFSAQRDAVEQWTKAVAAPSPPGTGSLNSSDAEPTVLAAPNTNPATSNVIQPTNQYGRIRRVRDTGVIPPLAKGRPTSASEDHHLDRISHKSTQTDPSHSASEKKTSTKEETNAGPDATVALSDPINKFFLPASRTPLPSPIDDVNFAPTAFDDFEAQLSGVSRNKNESPLSAVNELTSIGDQLIDLSAEKKPPGLEAIQARQLDAEPENALANEQVVRKDISVQKLPGSDGHGNQMQVTPDASGQFQPNQTIPRGQPSLPKVGAENLPLSRGNPEASSRSNLNILPKAQNTDERPSIVSAHSTGHSPSSLKEKKRLPGAEVVLLNQRAASSSGQRGRLSSELQERLQKRIDASLMGSLPRNRPAFLKSVGSGSKDSTSTLQSNSREVSSSPSGHNNSSVMAPPTFTNKVQPTSSREDLYATSQTLSNNDKSLSAHECFKMKSLGDGPRETASSRSSSSHGRFLIASPKDQLVSSHQHETFRSNSSLEPSNTEPNISASKESLPLKKVAPASQVPITPVRPGSLGSKFLENTTATIMQVSPQTASLGSPRYEFQIPDHFSPFVVPETSSTRDYRIPGGDGRHYYFQGDESALTDISSSERRDPSLPNDECQNSRSQIHNVVAESKYWNRLETLQTNPCPSRNGSEWMATLTPAATPLPSSVSSIGDRGSSSRTESALVDVDENNDQLSEVSTQTHVRAPRLSDPALTPISPLAIGAFRPPANASGSRQRDGRNVDPGRETSSGSPFFETLQTSSEIASRSYKRTMGQNAAGNGHAATVLNGPPSTVAALYGETKQMLELARSFRGEVKMRIELGRILMKGIPRAFHKPFSAEVWGDLFSPGPQESTEAVFTNMITTSALDTEYIWNLEDDSGKRLFNAFVDGFEVTYQFSCLNGKNEEVFVEVNGESFEYVVKTSTRTFGKAYLHFGKRNWDARMSITGARLASPDYPGARELADNLYVETGQSLLSLTTKTDLKDLHVEAVFLRRHLRHPSAQYSAAGDPFALVITEVQELVVDHFANVEGAIRASARPPGDMIEDGSGDTRLWYEVALHSSRADSFLCENQGTEVGEEAGWNIDDVLGSEQGFESWIELACAVVTRIDGVGINNVGPIRPPPVRTAPSTATQSKPPQGTTRSLSRAGSEKPTSQKSSEKPRQSETQQQSTQAPVAVQQPQHSYHPETQKLKPDYW